MANAVARSRIPANITYQPMMAASTRNVSPGHAKAMMPAITLITPNVTCSHVHCLVCIANMIIISPPPMSPKPKKTATAQTVS